MPIIVASGARAQDISTAPSVAPPAVPPISAADIIAAQAQSRVVAELPASVRPVPEGAAMAGGVGGGGTSNSANKVEADAGRATRPTRNEAMRREQETKLRQLMAAFGVSDAGVQDALLLHIDAQIRAQANLRRLGIDLYAALRRPGLGDDEVRGLLENYQQALSADEENRARTEESLNERIRFRAQPRLQAMLMLFGVIGNNPVLIPFTPNRPIGKRPPNRPGDNRILAPVPNNRRPRRGEGARLSPPELEDDALPARALPAAPVFPNPIVPVDGTLHSTTPPVTTPKAPDALEIAGEGELNGVIVAQRPESVDIQLPDGTVRAFSPRMVGPVEGLDGEMLRVLATLVAGQRVHLRWIWEAEPRLLAIQALGADE